MPNKFDFDSDGNPTLKLNGSSKTVLVLFDTNSKDEAEKMADAIAGFTPHLEMIGPSTTFPGHMAVVGDATMLIEEEGDVSGVFPFGGVIESCSVCQAKQ